LQDAEKFADDDKKIKERVEARNELESYAYSLKNQLGDKEKLGGKLSDEEKTTMEESIDEAIKWLESNSDSADSSEFRAKKKSLEDVVQPIITKLYQQSGGVPPTAGGDESGGDKDEL